MKKEEKKEIRQSESHYMPSEVFSIGQSNIMASMETVEDSADIFDEDGEDVSVITIPGVKKYRYVSFGPDDKLPFEIIRLIGVDEVMSQNKLFNVLTCYGAGQKYMDIATEKPTQDKEIKKWLLHNSIPAFMLEQATDVKYFFYCVSVVILSNDGKRITKLRHKESCYCRFEKADDKGKINHVFYANFRKSSLREQDVEVIRLLDEKDPLGDLEVLMGREPGADGLKKVRTHERKFAILVRFPTPGCQYYPVPYYTAIFRGDWFDIKRLIGKGKKAKLKNHASVKYQVEVHKDFWQNILDEERITDPVKQMERLKQEKENIKKFVAESRIQVKFGLRVIILIPTAKKTGWCVLL